MASGFVSGGTLDAPVKRDDEWLAAQKEIEDLRRKRAEESKQNDGRSLFEILEANKVAKQDAFEEANKLKNQFRSLDEDEIEFLDSIMESTRREEEKVKKETKESLEAFRRQQELADKRLNGDVGGTEVEEEQWAAGPRKRKRAKEKEGLKGVRLRKSSTSDQSAVAESPSSYQTRPTTSDRPSPPKIFSSKTLPTTKAAATPGTIEDRAEIKPGAAFSKKRTSLPSALVAYGSDDDDDD